MSQRQAIEAALRAWREAERQVAAAGDGERIELQRQVKLHRDLYQQLSTENMVETMSRLREAEDRRSHAVPSTLPFHDAARDTQDIAAEIWEAARSSDEDTPETERNRRTTPRPLRPGVRAG